MLNTRLIKAQDSGRLRLMVVLHGLGDSMEGYFWLPAALRLPWLNYLLVDAPDPYFGGYSWYDFGGDPGPGIERSRRLLEAVLREQVAGGFAVGQTMLFGFSQGCLMVMELGLSYPEPFAGLIGVSGYVHQPSRLLERGGSAALQQRILMTHGREDPLIPIAKVRKQASDLQAAGVNLDWREFDKAHTIAGEEELTLIRDFTERCYAVAPR